LIARLLPGPGLLGPTLCLLLMTLALAGPGRAQRPLLDRVRPSQDEVHAEAEGQPGSGAADPAAANAAGSGDPLVAIDDALAEARSRKLALERARQVDPDTETDAPPPPPSESLELASRLVRVLEQRREAQLRMNELVAGRDAIRAMLERDPRELFGEPPPFAVPLLDNVRQAWQREAEQEAQQRGVLEDQRANLRLAEDEQGALQKERRRLRDLLQREKDELARIRLEAGIRVLDDRIRVAGERVALAGQRVRNATLEHEIKDAARRQARAALAWVQAHVTPRESDLADAIERLDRERIELDREIELARSDLIRAEATLQAAEERNDGVGAADEWAPELEARRHRLAHQQHRVALLSQQIERLGRMRVSWQHRYAVLGGALPIEEAPGWLASAERELERLTRDRRIQEAELAELRLELAGLLRRLAAEPAADADGVSRGAQRWLEMGLEDLEARVALVQRDLASLDRAIQLEERLRAELADRIAQRDLGERMRSLADRARRFWSYELTTSEDRPITPGKILIGLLVFVVGYLVARFLTSLTAKRLFPRLGFDAGASSAFASLTFYALLAMTFLFALRAVNIPLTAFAVVGGALALGIGFGSQAIVSNFISGLLLLAERPIRTGDLIEVSGVVGTVDSIGLRSTRIRTADNFHIIVPNSSFLETNVVNWTHEDPDIRLRVIVGVAYGSPTRKVEELLLLVANEHPRCLRHPAPVVNFRDFGDSALSFEVRFWIRYDARTDRTAIQSDVRYRIDELFREHGITIAFPQMDVHLDVSRATPPDRPPSNDRPDPG
jgi:small-conductance mechanosensitive channel